MRCKAATSGIGSPQASRGGGAEPYDASASQTAKVNQVAGVVERLSTVRGVGAKVVDLRGARGGVQAAIDRL
jgi:hypothetical protein